MPTVKVPLFSPVYRNVDGVELTDQTSLLVDGYTDELGYSRKRPGLSVFTQLGEIGTHPVNGLFWWPQKNCVLAVCNGKTFKITYTYGSASVSNLTSATLATNAAVSCAFGWNAAFASYAFLANGGNIIYTDGSALTVALTTSGVPTLVSHLAFIDGYLLANNLSTTTTALRNQIMYSPVNDTLAAGGWSDYFSAAGNSDYILAVAVLNREIYLIGQSTTEIWENDGVTPFSRSASGFIESGCAAAHSPVIVGGSIYWLSDKRHFVKWTNGRMQKISSPYDKDISNFSSVSDATGHSVEIDGVQLIIWSFPTENRTLVYSLPINDNGITPGSWSEWRHWDSTNLEYNRFLGNCHCWIPDWGLHLVGDKETSTIYSMSPGYFNDNGDEIRFYRKSGHIDYGTTREKISNQLRLRARRGDGISSGTPKLLVSWLDDNKRQSNEHELSLGDSGEREIVLRMFRTGRYRTRQYEFSATDNIPVVFGDAEEDVTVI